MKKKVLEVEIGDIINVNTGYRPLDDEDCEVLDIRTKFGLFGDEAVEFLIDSYHGKHWYECSLTQKYGDNEYITHVTVKD